MVAKEFSKFCQETSLPGWGNMVNAGSHCKKFFWIVLLIGCHFAVFLLCYISTQHFMDSGTLTITRSTSENISDITFPVLALCNINQMQGSFLKQLGSDDDPEVQELFVSEFLYGRSQDLSMDQELKLVKMKEKMEKEFAWNTQIPATDLAVQKSSEMILYFYYQGFKYVNHEQEYNFDYPHHRSRNDFGTCFYQDINLGRVENILKAKSAVRNGLHLIIDLESFEYSDSALGSQGWRFWLGQNSDKPLFGYLQTNLAPGNEYLIAVTPSVVKTTDEAFLRFDPLRRGCYADHELDLKYFSPDYHNYTLQTCLYNAAIDGVIAKCNCTPNFMPGAIR